MKILQSIHGQTLAWRGAALGDTYSIERSSAGENGPWSVICQRCATDKQSPWKDKNQPSGSLWYRIQAYNLAGVAGPYSPVYRR
jgi:mannan endo-1,4-beta-mannosidase